MNGKGEGNGLFSNVNNTALWSIIVAALSLGGGSGLYTAASTQDRFTGEQFRSEIRSRDIEISFLKQQLAESRVVWKDAVQEARRHRDEDHPPESVKEALADHENRLRANKM